MRAVRRRREQRMGALQRATADEDTIRSQSPHTTSKAKAAQMSTAEFDDVFGPSKSLMQDYSFEEYSLDHSKAGGGGVSKKGKVRRVVNKKNSKQSSKGSQALLERKKRQQQLFSADASSNSQTNSRASTKRPLMTRTRTSSMSTKTLGSSLSFSATLSSGDLLASTSNRISMRGSKLAAALMRRPSHEMDDQPSVTLSDGVAVADEHESNNNNNDSDSDEEEEVTPFTDKDLLGSSSKRLSVQTTDENNNNNNNNNNNDNNNNTNEVWQASPTHAAAGSSSKLLSVLTTDDDLTSTSVLWRAPRTLTQESDGNNSGGGSLRKLFSFRSKGGGNTLERRRRLKNANAGSTNTSGRSLGNMGNSGRSLGNMGNSGRSLGGMSLMSEDSSMTFESRSTSPMPVLGRRKQSTFGHGSKKQQQQQRQQQQQQQQERNNGSNSSNSPTTAPPVPLSRSKFASGAPTTKGNGTMKRSLSRKELKLQRNASRKQATATRRTKGSSARSIKARSGRSNKTQSSESRTARSQSSKSRSARSNKTQSSKSTSSVSSSSSSSLKPRVFIKSVETLPSTMSGRPNTRSGRSNNSTFSSSSSGSHKSRVFIKSIDSATVRPTHALRRNQSEGNTRHHHHRHHGSNQVDSGDECESDICSDNDVMFGADVTPWGGVGLTDDDVVGSLGKSFNRMLSRQDIFNTAYSAPILPNHIPDTTGSGSGSNGSLLSHISNTRGSGGSETRRSSGGSVVPDAYMGTDVDWDTRLLAVRELRMRRTISLEEAESRTMAKSMDV